MYIYARKKYKICMCKRTIKTSYKEKTTEKLIKNLSTNRVTLYIESRSLLVNKVMSLTRQSNLSVNFIKTRKFVVRFL